MIQKGLKFPTARSSAGTDAGRGGIKDFVHGIGAVDNGFLNGAFANIVAATNDLSFILAIFVGMSIWRSVLIFQSRYQSTFQLELTACHFSYA